MDRTYAFFIGWNIELSRFSTPYWCGKFELLIMKEISFVIIICFRFYDVPEWTMPNTDVLTKIRSNAPRTLLLVHLCLVLFLKSLIFRAFLAVGSTRLSPLRPSRISSVQGYLLDWCLHLLILVRISSCHRKEAFALPNSFFRLPIPFSRNW